MVWLALIREILNNICVVILCLPDCDVINFEVTVICLTKTSFVHAQKIKTKIKISWEQRELLRWNKKHPSFLKSYHWSKWKEFFFEGDSLTLSHSSWRLKSFLNLVISLSVRLFQNGSCWGFTDFLVPILSQALIAPALIRFLKPLISFKVTLEIALVIHYLVSQPPRLLCQVLLFHIRHCPQGAA